MADSPFYRVAQTYLENGFSIIPIIPGKKAPGQYYNDMWTPMNGWDAFRSRHPTQKEIDLWSSWPEAGIGLILGSLSGVVALDFDKNIDGLHEKILALIPASSVRKRGSKGFTAFYRFNGEKTKKWSRNGESVIELLSDGRQTVIPPTPHPSGSNYVWTTLDTLESFELYQLPVLPDNFVELVNGILEVKKKVTNHNYINKYHASSSFEDVERALTYINSDDYETWLQIGMGLKTELSSRGFSLWDKWSATSTKYKSDDAKKKWESFNSAGINIGTIFYHAINGGYVPRPFGAEISKINFALEEKPEPKKTSNGHASNIMFNPPGLVGAIYNWILQTSLQPQPLIALASAISATGVVMGHRVRSETNLRTNMLTLGLAPSSAGKDHARKCIISLFSAAGVEKLQGGTPVSGAGLLSSVQAGSGRRLLQIDEMGRVLKSLTGKNAMSHQSDILTNIMMLFSQANSKFFGSEYANHDGKFSRKDIDQPCLCIFGTTVPSRFYQALTSEETIDGFLSRWLIFESKDASPKRNPDAPGIEEPPPYIVQAIKFWEQVSTNPNPKSQGNLESTFVNPQIIPFTAEAKEILNQFYEESDQERVKAFNAGLSTDAIWGRAHEHAIKLSLCAHTGNAITPEATLWGVETARYCVEASIAAIHKRMSDNQQEADTRKLLAIIESNRRRDGWISKRELTRKTYWLNPFQRSGIVNSLLEAGELEQGEHKSSENSQKPTTFYRAVS